ncbi:hypothetical protein ANN_23765 [Periplaneta americana]|uniref:PiggyBac transposable element-derived protein domain-containing protein n=1 Tax=Periplaneta americana TaxID=6978 RepID=A0ABQ8SM06_PERAM|nr:hypothetical protein ANN_23765 [Periplaneta americana]
MQTRFDILKYANERARENTTREESDKRKSTEFSKLSNRARKVVFSDESTFHVYGPTAWPPRSPDLTPLDFFFWGYIKDIVYKTVVADLDDLHRRIVAACATVTPEMLRNTWQELEYRLDICRATRDPAEFFECLVTVDETPVHEVEARWEPCPKKSFRSKWRLCSGIRREFFCWTGCPTVRPLTMITTAIHCNFAIAFSKAPKENGGAAFFSNMAGHMAVSTPFPPCVL